MSVIAQQWVSLDGHASGVDGEAEIFDAAGPDSDAASQEYNARILPSVAEILLTSSAGARTSVTLRQSSPVRATSRDRHDGR